MTKKKKWYDYLWIVSATYLILGFFNILFAWIGLLCFFIPLLIAIFGGDKMYCNKFCGRGQLFDLLGNKLGLSRKKDIPKFLRSKWFRYGFLIFFFIMFFNMLFSVMLTSTVLGLITMILYKPRSWCVYCPMGTMTQTICKAKHRCNGACGIPQQNDSPTT